MHAASTTRTLGIGDGTDCGSTRINTRRYRGEEIPTRIGVEQVVGYKHTRTPTHTHTHRRLIGRWWWWWCRWWPHRGSPMSGQVIPQVMARWECERSRTHTQSEGTGAVNTNAVTTRMGDRQQKWVL